MAAAKTSYPSALVLEVFQTPVLEFSHNLES